MIQCGVMRMFLGMIFLVFCWAAFADTDYNSVANMSLAQKHKYISSLKEEISELQTKISECERKTRGWRGATVAGSIGTAASLVGIGVQMQQKKSAQSDKNATNDNKNDDNKNDNNKADNENE